MVVGGQGKLCLANRRHWISVRIHLLGPLDQNSDLRLPSTSSASPPSTSPSPDSPLPVAAPPSSSRGASATARMSFLRLLPQRLPQFVRQVERDVETVINVLQPGPIGILEHKFTDAEIREAQTTVKSAVENWRRNWTLERNPGTGSFDKSK